jgi:hypothetical protein
MTVPRSFGRGLAAVALTAMLAAAGLLTACSGPAGHPDAESASSAPVKPSPTNVGQYVPASSSPSATPPAASPSPSAQPVASAPAPEPVAGPGPCATTAVRLTIGPSNGAAGSFYYPLQFTNISGATCTMYGYPGVAFATSAGGAVIGGPAVRNPTFPKELVALAPGATVHASLQVAIAANYPTHTCDPVTAHWLQVFPPNQYTALYVAFTAQTCTGSIPSGSTLGIYVVRPGATGP